MTDHFFARHKLKQAPVLSIQGVVLSLVFAMASGTAAYFALKAMGA